jgi:transcriptional regulator with XRE-family HTH domain
LGLTQYEFAAHLGISKSLLQKAEYGRRTVPTHALVKLASLEILLCQPKPQPAPHPVELEESYLNDHAASMIRYRQECRLTEAANLECKLKMMEARYRQLRNSLEHVERLMAAGKTSPIALGPAQLAMHHYMLLRRISKCGQPAQRALQQKISLLYAAAALEQSGCQELNQQHKTAMQKVYTAFHGESQPAR